MVFIVQSYVLMDERQNVLNVSVDVTQQYHVLLVRSKFQRHAVWICIICIDPDEFFQFVVHSGGPSMRHYQVILFRRNGDRYNYGETRAKPYAGLGVLDDGITKCGLHSCD